MFPLTFTLAIITLWVRIIPTGVKKELDEINKEDQELIGQTRYAIREFVNNLITNLKHLHDYLT